MTDDVIQSKILSLLTRGSATRIELLGYLHDVLPDTVERNLRTLMSQGKVVGSGAGLTSVFQLCEIANGRRLFEQMTNNPMAEIDDLHRRVEQMQKNPTGRDRGRAATG